MSAIYVVRRGDRAIIGQTYKDNISSIAEHWNWNGLLFFRTNIDAHECWREFRNELTIESETEMNIHCKPCDWNEFILTIENICDGHMYEEDEEEVKSAPQKNYHSRQIEYLAAQHKNNIELMRMQHAHEIEMEQMKQCSKNSPFSMRDGVYLNSGHTFGGN